MPHNVALISTIAVGLVYALIGGLLAARLRLPPLVGYLLASPSAHLRRGSWPM
jgi:CPA2 family monovalent cation:H+ antiporter-2